MLNDPLRKEVSKKCTFSSSLNNLFYIEDSLNPCDYKVLHKQILLQKYYTETCTNIPVYNSFGYK